LRNSNLPGLILYLFLVAIVISPPLYARNVDWQQEVNYELDVTLLDEAKSIGGSCLVTYINNSPDTLSTIWFRFPADALNNKSTVNKTPRRRPAGYFDKIPSWQYGGMTIQSIESENQNIRLIQDGSIGSVDLEDPLIPGDTIMISMEFTTKFPMGRAASRIGWTNGQYKGAYWYPMICPYTPEYGWTVNRYYGTAEAFGEFGDFLVKYRVPNGFIVASTGELINESEVLPQDKLDALSINNTQSVEIPFSGQKIETWIYFAENVPDVAFAMDRNFRIEKIDFGNFQSWSFVRKGREKEWHDAAEICGWTIQQLEGIYGPYPWNRVVATDSWSAMEYPQLTMMSSSSPRYTYVMIHEVVHNYTPMILHSSSVDEVWIDEGFTTFIEHELTNRWYDNKYNRIRSFDRGPFRKKFVVQDEVLRGKRPYLEAVLNNEDKPMHIGTDTAENYMTMRVSSYYKTPVMLNALRYVIGEAKFWQGFKNLYRDHVLSHITEKDVVDAFEEASGRSLGWFFNQYIHSSEDIDYSLEIDGNELLIRRVGEIKLPLKIEVEWDDGVVENFVIPFLKSDLVEDGYKVLGYWDQIHEPGRTFTELIDRFDGRLIVKAQINKDGFLVDRNPLNDTFPEHRIISVFDSEVLPIEPYPVDAYRHTYGLSKGYKIHNGFMTGISLNGSYMGHDQNYSIEGLYPFKNSDDGMQFRMGISQPISKMPGETNLTTYFGKMHEDRWYEMGIQRKWRSWGSLYRSSEINTRIGTWERREPNGIRKATPYIFGSLRLESSIYSRINWEQEISFVNEIAKPNAIGIEWNGEVRKRIYRYWMGIFESRASYSSPELTSRFKGNLKSGSPYDRLGHPIVGGMVGKTDNSAWPMTYTNAQMSSLPGNLVCDAFYAYEINIYRPISSRYLKWTYDSFRNLVEMMAVGIYQSSALFHEEGEYKLGLGAEVGFELGVYKFYGADIVLRLTPFYKWQTEDGRLGSSPGAWDRERWNNHLYLYVSLNTDKFFRK